MAEERIPAEMLAKVEPEWKEDMLQFLNEGRARKEFLDHLDLDTCSSCNALVDHVLDKDAVCFQNLAKSLREAQEARKREREEKLKKCGFWRHLWYRISGQL